MAVGGYVGVLTVTAGSTAAIVIDDPTNITTQPQWVRLWTLGKNGTGTGTGDLILSAGWWDGSSHFALGAFCDDAASATATRSAVTNSRILLELDGSAITGHLTGASLDANGFTLTISDAFANTVTVIYEVGWGYTNAKVLNYQRATSTGSKSYTGAGFQANAVHFLGSAQATLDTAQNGASCSVGMASGSGAQVVNALVQRISGQTTNYTWGMLNTSHIYAALNGGTGAISNSDAFTSFDANGFTLNQDAGTTATYCSALLLNAPNVAFATTVAQSGAGTFTTAVSGLTPTVCWGLSNPVQTASQAAGVEGQAMLAWGAIVGASQCAILVHTANRETLSGGQLTEEYSRSATDRFLLHYDRTGADTFTAAGEIAASSFGPQVVTLNQTDGDPTAGLIALMVVGGPPNVDAAVSFSLALAGAGAAQLVANAAATFDLALSAAAAGQLVANSAVAFDLALAAAASAQLVVAASVSYDLALSAAVAGQLVADAAASFGLALSAAVAAAIVGNAAASFSLALSFAAAGNVAGAYRFDDTVPPAPIGSGAPYRFTDS